MSPLLLTLMLAAAPIAASRGFSFQVPDGFGPFPGFTPKGNKLYAYGRNLGSPEAITLTLDAAEGPVTPGGPSESCRKLMQSIDRTVGSPLKEQWNGTELLGMRMVMTHVFGEVVVLCADVPVKPAGVTLMVSGKAANEPALRETFTSVLSSISTAEEPRPFPVALVVAGIVSVLFLFVFVRRVRGSASRSSR